MNFDIEMLLAYIGLSDFKTQCAPVGSKQYQKISVGHFNKADPLGLIDQLTDRRFFNDVTPKCLKNPLDITMAINTKIPSELQMMRIRQVLPTDMKFNAKYMPGKTFDIAVAWLDTQNLSAQTSRGMFNWIIKYDQQGDYLSAKVVNAFDGAVFEGNREEIETNIRLACSLQMTNEYYWQVEMGFEKSRLIKVPTDYAGVKEVFRLRDMPNGSSRRKALLHWVSDHYRKKRDDSNTKVDSYLRGKTKFIWNGMMCNIYPAIYDVRALVNKTRASQLLDGLAQ